MIHIRRTTALFISLACLAVGAAQDPVQIAWKPKAGTTIKYKLEVKPEAPGMDITVFLDLTSKTVEIKEDGKVLVKTTSSNSKFFINGVEQGFPSDEGSSTATYLPSGEIVEVKSEGGMDNPRLSDSLVMIYPDRPVKPGDQWLRTKKGDPKVGTVDSETTYTYLGTETIGIFKTYKIKFEFKETKGSNPMSVTTTVWLSVEDGELVKVESAVQNVEFQPGMPPMNATYRMTRVG